MRRPAMLRILTILVFAASSLSAQLYSAEQIEVAPPLPRAEAPSPNATAAELEKRGDDLRMNKAYLDALDYYKAAITKDPHNASLYNKLGITELTLQRRKDARKDFERAIRSDRQHADAYNNLGVTYYFDKRYGKAIDEYQKAIAINPQSASFRSNLGTVYFQKKDYEKAALLYYQALQLDPEVFERSSRAGVSAKMQSPEDRARYDYMVARMYAKLGLLDRSLQHLRRAMEEQYKDIENVYKDKEFAELRKDQRFSDLMAAKPAPLPE